MHNSLLAVTPSHFELSDSTDTLITENNFLSDSSDIFNTENNLLLDSASLTETEVDSAMFDSTYRLKNFQFIREDDPLLSFEPKRKISFYAYPSERNVRRTVELDSTGNFVIIKELVAGAEIRNYLKIPLDEYIKLKLESVERGSWDKLGYKYVLKDKKDDLGQLFSNITNIEIPLPSVGFLSIFGPPKISLKINGAVDIHGAWRNETTEGGTASLLGNTRNEPDFKQQVQINVNGTIGDKLTIAADWNTERTFEFENQLKLHYKGYKDEIVQSIEAGNVSLQTSPLVGGGEALFGIKALFQFGPFSLTALASQKKSEVDEVSVSGGSQKSEFTVRAYEYSQNHYFVDLAYASTHPDTNMFEKYYGNANALTIDEFRIKELEVWKTTSAQLDIQKQRRASAFIDLEARESADSPAPYPDSFRDLNYTPVPGRSVVNDRFVRLEDGVDYDYNPYVGLISFRTQVNTEDAIAVAYRTEGKGSGDNFYGEFIREVENDTSTVLVLKLIKPKKLQPGGDFADAWKLQLKNIYPIGGRDVKKENFTFDINFQFPGQEPARELEGKNILQAFGLDLTDESGTGGPDGAFDWDPGRTIIPKTGEIIFPKLQPFGNDFPFSEELKYQAVYDTSVTYARQDNTKDKFVLVGEYSADASSVYNIGFNVVENSVKVTLDGRQMDLGKDYSVDYNIGQVVIRNASALVPGANLKITYEKNDLFQLASKTLLGLRGIYDMSEKTKFGFSYLNLNQTTLSDKVRIGEEPLNNSIFGLDFQTGLDLPFITKGLDNIISTKEMSSVSLKGEFAYMSPDPNTKKSNIDSDGKQSIAYVDDFEGAKRIIPVGVSYTGWRDISVPDKIFGLEGFTKQQQMNYKAKSYWFNFLPSNVLVEDIWGDRKKVSRHDDRITVLDYVFNPNNRGAYNYTPVLDDKSLLWGGIMRPLSSTASNLVEENIEYIEFWLKLEEAPEGSKIYMDLGQISEDIIPNLSLDQEDKNQNDRLDEGEDVGLDGMTNAKEISTFGAEFDDPSGDKYSFILGSGDYTKINGTEGNGTLNDAGRLPDSEDMNKNFTFDNVNSYFRYEIPLDTNRATNELISGGGDNKGWWQFRIPLKEFTSKVGSPSFTIIEVLRLWISDVQAPVHLRLAEINLVGNQWQKVVVPGKVEENDTTLVISTINYEDNPEYLTPPGVQRERDRTNTEEEIFKNEQSLRLVVTDLEDGDKREIVKYLFRPLDVFDYKEMKLFVRGEQSDLPGSISYFEDANNYGSEVYFRFGTDTANFYEYRQPVTKGLQDPSHLGWSEISIEFAKLTAIKQVRTEITELYTLPVEGEVGHFYGVKGNPTLTRVNFFSFGIRNPSNRGFEGSSVSGELWVNELRVLGADDTPGWAYSASSQVKFADLMTVSVNASKTDPFFHRLNERFGKRVDNSQWSGAVNFDVIKLLPWNLTGSSFGLNYSRSESISKPLYMPGTDINVDEAVKQERIQLIDSGMTESQADLIAEEIRTNSQSVNITDTWSISSIKLNLPSKDWYIQDIINNLQFSFSFNKNFSRSPSVIYSNGWQWNGSSKYSVNFSKDNYIFAADIPLIGSLIEIFTDYKNVKLYFSPQSFNTGLSANRRYSASLSRTDNAEINTQRDFTSKRDFGFNWKLTEGGLLNLSIGYNVNLASSYAHLLTFNDFERSESEIWNDILNGQYFGKDYSYSQSFSVKTDPKLPSLWDMNKYITISMGFNNTYNWTNNFKQEDLGRSAGYSNSVRAGFGLKLKALTTPLFEETKIIVNPTSKTFNKPVRGRTNTPKVVKVDDEESEEKEESEENKELVQEGINEEELNAGVQDSIDAEPKVMIFSTALNYLKMASKWLFFDYENIDVDFSQTVSVSGSGIKETGTGFTNFWGLQSIERNGPSRSFMLGLSSDLGARASNGNLSDNFSEKNSLDFKTSRPLWEGANISLNWRIGWGLNRTTSLSTDEYGNITINNVSSTGSLDKTFMYLPIFFSKAGIVEAQKIYIEDPNRDIAKAFSEGFESMPILANIPLLKDIAKFLPRANWRLNWRGLEKLEFIKGIAKSVSLDHAYTSGYTEGWKVDPDGKKQIQTQRINYGFSPLLGMNITFDNIWDGNLTSSVKYSTKTSFDLGIATRNITESFSRDINVTASFSKSGFSLPLFGLDLKNDIEMSLSYTRGQNSVVIFEMDSREFNEEGKPQDGTTRTIIEPRIKYTLSSKVTLSIFYKRTAIEPEGASRIPPTTTNEAGLDVHISIQ